MINNITFFLRSSYYNLLAQFQYKVNFIVSLLSVSLDVLCNLLVFYFIFSKFHNLAGWNFQQVIFLYAIFLAGHGLVLTFSLNLWGFFNYLITGNLDRLRVRPRNILLQLLSTSFSISAFIYFIASVVLIIYAWIEIGIPDTLGLVIAMIISVISSCFVELSITLIFVSLSFWLVNTSSLISLNVQVLNDFLGYPLNIYNNTLRVIFTVIYPIAFMNYYPGLFFLKPSTKNFILLMITPLIASILFYLAVRLFFKGMKEYQSVGS